jgi:hypothetical protein
MIVDGQHRYNAICKLNRDNQLSEHLYLPVCIHVVHTDQEKIELFNKLSSGKPVNKDMVFHNVATRNKIEETIKYFNRKSPLTYTTKTKFNRPYWNDDFFVALARELRWFDKSSLVECVKILNDKLFYADENELATIFNISKTSLLKCYRDKFYLGIIDVNNRKHMEYIEKLI